MNIFFAVWQIINFLNYLCKLLLNSKIKTTVILKNEKDVISTMCFNLGFG